MTADTETGELEALRAAHASAKEERIRYGDGTTAQWASALNFERLQAAALIAALEAALASAQRERDAAAAQVIIDNKGDHDGS